MKVCICGRPVVAVAFVLSLVFAQNSPAQPPIKKEDLRYDDKPFWHWQTCWRTELKLERRLDVIRAMAAFGSRGYAEEAAAVILDIVKEYDSSLLESGWQKWPEAQSIDEKEIQQIVNEAVRALVTIGPKSSVVLAARLSHKTVSSMVEYPLIPGIRVDGGSGRFSNFSIVPAAVPLLAQQLNKDDPARSAAMALLCECGFKGKENVAALGAILERKEDSKAFFSALVKAIKDREGADYNAWDILAKLGPKASPAVPGLATDLKSFHKTVKKEIAQNGITNNTGSFGEPPSEMPPKWCNGPANHASRQYIEGLSDMGSAAEYAMPVLELFAKDSTPHLSDLATKAMAKIRAKR